MSPEAAIHRHPVIIVLLLLLVGMSAASRQRCPDTEPEVTSYEISTLDGLLRQVHIRHNFKGKIYIEDGLQSRIGITLVRRGSLPLDSILKSAGETHTPAGSGQRTLATVKQIDNSGDMLTFVDGVLRLQLDYRAPLPVVHVIVISSAVIVAILATITLTVYMYQRHKRPTSPASSRSSNHEGEQQQLTESIQSPAEVGDIHNVDDILSEKWIGSSLKTDRMEPLGDSATRMETSGSSDTWKLRNDVILTVEGNDKNNSVIPPIATDNRSPDAHPPVHAPPPAQSSRLAGYVMAASLDHRGAKTSSSSPSTTTDTSTDGTATLAVGETPNGTTRGNRSPRERTQRLSSTRATSTESPSSSSGPQSSTDSDVNDARDDTKADSKADTRGDNKDGAMGDDKERPTAATNAVIGRGQKRCYSGGGGGGGSKVRFSPVTTITFTLMTILMSVTASSQHQQHPRQHQEQQQQLEAEQECRYPLSTDSPVVDIVITMPRSSPSERIEAIKIYLNKAFNNEIDTSRWTNKNATKLHIYDITSASHTSSLPCDSEIVCPDFSTIPFAHQSSYVFEPGHSLYGCDIVEGNVECICRRGYEINEQGQCIDIDECLNRNFEHGCSNNSTCINTVGSYSCLCSEGYFLTKEGVCKECRTLCEENQFRVKDCTHYSDIQCKGCTACEESHYEFKRCERTKDRECIHVAFPIIENARIIQSQHSATELIVEHSDNVFIDRLDSSQRRLLTSPNYITDRRQMFDFLWYRDSGIRVNIGLERVNILPEYETVNYSTISDNEFITSMDRGSTENERNHFKNIIRNYCKYPLPDYYSLTLEISRDRATLVDHLCTRGHCTWSRSLNQACHKLGSIPENLETAVNSAICLKDNGLLKTIFNYTERPVNPIRFGPERCRLAKGRCKSCYNNKSCDKDDRCCTISCEQTKACKHVSSRTCSSSSVECAMGDAYRLTLEPVLRNVLSDYRCHLKRRKHSPLFNLWFYITIPKYRGNLQNSSELRYKSRRARFSVAEPKTDVNFDTLKFAFLTVSYSRGELLSAGEEVMLSGVRGSLTGGQDMTFSIAAMRPAAQYDRTKDISITSISDTVKVASLQLDAPFVYSTSNWLQGETGCEGKKDISHFVGVQAQSLSNNKTVNVRIENTRDSHIYTMVSMNEHSTDIPKRAFLQLEIPGSESLLSWAFSDNPLPNNLTARLHSSPHYWTIQVLGSSNDRNTYFKVCVDDVLATIRLGTYDVMVTGPTSSSAPIDIIVNFTYSRPIGPSSYSLRVTFTSAKGQSHRVLLSHLMRKDNRRDSEEQVSDAIAERSELVSLDNLVIVMVINYLVIVVVLILVHGRHASGPDHSIPVVVDHRTSSTSRIHSTATSKHVVTTTGDNEPRRRCSYYAGLALAVCWRVVITLTLTFTMLIALYVFLCLDVRKYTNDLNNFTFRNMYETNGDNFISKLDSTEIERTNAVNQYFFSELKSTSKHLQKALLKKMNTKFQHSGEYANMVISNMTIELRQYAVKRDLFSDSYIKGLNEKLETPLRIYSNMMKTMYTKGWFSKEILNSSNYIEISNKLNPMKKFLLKFENTYRRKVPMLPRKPSINNNDCKQHFNYKSKFKFLKRNILESDIWIFRNINHNLTKWNVNLIQYTRETSQRFKINYLLLGFILLDILLVFNRILEIYRKLLSSLCGRKPAAKRRTSLPEHEGDDSPPLRHIARCAGRGLLSQRCVQIIVVASAVFLVLMSMLYVGRLIAFLDALVIRKAIKIHNSLSGKDTSLSLLSVISDFLGVTTKHIFLLHNHLKYVFADFPISNYLPANIDILPISQNKGVAYSKQNMLNSISHIFKNINKDILNTILYIYFIIVVVIILKITNKLKRKKFHRNQKLTSIINNRNNSRSVETNV